MNQSNRPCSEPLHPVFRTRTQSCLFRLARQVPCFVDLGNELHSDALLSVPFEQILRTRFCNIKSSSQLRSLDPSADTEEDPLSLSVPASSCARRFRPQAESVS